MKGRFAIRVTTPLGDQATIALRGPGDSFGEMALLGGGGHRSATVESLEHGETFCLYKTEIAGLAGTTRATANATLRDAQERGLVRLTRGKVEVLDSEELARRSRR